MMAWRLILPLLGLTFCAGCGSDVESTRLVGTWHGRPQVSDADVHTAAGKAKAETVILTMDLRRGGIAVMSGPLTQSATEIKGIWRLMEADASEGRLKIGVSQDVHIASIKFESEDRFLMNWKKTSPLIFTRSKSESTTP